MTTNEIIQAMHTAKVYEAASAQGFHSFRIAGYNGEAPDFAKAVTV